MLCASKQTNCNCVGVQWSEKRAYTPSSKKRCWCSLFLVFLFTCFTLERWNIFCDTDTKHLDWKCRAFNFAPTRINFGMTFENCFATIPFQCKSFIATFYHSHIKWMFACVQRNLNFNYRKCEKLRLNFFSPFIKALKW